MRSCAEGRAGRLQEPASYARKHFDGQEDGGGAGEFRLHAGPVAGADRQGALRPGRDLRTAYSKSKSTADQLAAQHQLSTQQLDVNQKAIAVQLASQQTKIDQAKALLDLYQRQAAALHVQAAFTGSLAPLATPVQVGQHVTAGTSMAEVIQLDKLKAALQIARPRRAISRSASRPRSTRITASYQGM